MFVLCVSNCTTTGNYNFIIEVSSTYKAMYSFELWLSTDVDPMKISRLALTQQPQSVRGGALHFVCFEEYMCVGVVLIVGG